MRDNHFSLETMTRLLAGDLPHEELVSEVIPHLVRSCDHCREQFQKILQMQKEFSHWDERVAVFEGQQAPVLLARLKEFPFDEQLGLVTDDENFQNWAFCQLLLKESLEAGFEDPAKAINYAELAVKVAQQLGPAYDPHWVLDLRAKAYSYLGNARRILGELRSAEAAFRKSEALLSKSMTGNPLILAEVLHLKASLRRAQRCPEEALGLTENAYSLYQANGDTHNAGMVLLTKAKIVEDTGRLEEAIGLLQQLIAGINARQESTLLLYARYNLMLCLTTAGRYSEAEALLPEIQAAFFEKAKPLDFVRLRWTEGKIALGLDRTEEAEKAFRWVQQEFLNRTMGYDAALVSLDLAVLLTQERRTQELKQLAAELMQAFEARDVHREAVAALLMFQRACDEERLTARLAKKIVSMLKEAKRPR